MTPTRGKRPALTALVAGLGLAVVATLVPHLAADALAGHIQAGYPSYGQERVDTAVTIWLVYLTTVGALGVLGWLGTLWAAVAGKRWASWLATALFVTGTGIALFDLLVEDTSGDTGLPTLIGGVGLLPCLAGALAVVTLWRAPTSGRSALRPARG